MLSRNYVDPTKKQLVVEMFCVLAAIQKRNPELQFSGVVDAEVIITDALDMFRKVGGDS